MIIIFDVSFLIIASMKVYFRCFNRFFRFFEFMYIMSKINIKKCGGKKIIKEITSQILKDPEMKVIEWRKIEEAI